MKGLADLFGRKRRESPRVEVKWLVDVKVPDTDHYLGFFTKDIGLGGVRLEGHSPDALRRIIPKSGRVGMRLRIPGVGEVFEVEAVVKWGHLNGDQSFPGWAFTRISRDARRFLKTYIEQHPEQIIGRSEAS